MRIELAKLDQTGNKFTHSYEPDEIVLDETHARLLNPPTVAGKVARTDSDVRVRGTVNALAEVDCDRCLKSVKLPIDARFDVKYLPADDYLSSNAAELEADDLSVSVFDGEIIDVDELVREQLLLALPSRALCGEECKGLCPICGADMNIESCECASSTIDPRWEGLKDLRF